MPEIVVLRAAAKGLRRLPAHNRDALIAKIEAYAADPSSRHAFAKPLTGRPGLRLRDGNYRAVVEWKDGRLQVLLVTNVGPRGSVY